MHQNVFVSSSPTNPGNFKFLLYNLHKTKEEKKCYSSIIDFFKQSIYNPSYKEIYSCVYACNLT